MYSRPIFTRHRAIAHSAPRATFRDVLQKLGLVLFIALIFTAADAFSAGGAAPKAERNGLALHMSLPLARVVD